MPRSVASLLLNDADEAQIQRWLAAFGTPQQVALRSRIVLASAAGESDSAIAERLDTNRKTVMLWRTRFAQEGLESLWDVAPGRWPCQDLHPKRSPPSETNPTGKE